MPLREDLSQVGGRNTSTLLDGVYTSGNSLATTFLACTCEDNESYRTGLLGGSQSTYYGPGTGLNALLMFLNPLQLPFYQC